MHTPTVFSVTVNGHAEEVEFLFSAYAMGGLSVQVARTEAAQQAAATRLGKKRVPTIVAVLSVCYPPWETYSQLADSEFLLKEFGDDHEIVKALVAEGLIVATRPELQCTLMRMAAVPAFHPY